MGLVPSLCLSWCHWCWSVKAVSCGHWFKISLYWYYILSCLILWISVNWLKLWVIKLLSLLRLYSSLSFICHRLTLFSTLSYAYICFLLSGELKNLKYLVASAKVEGITVVSPLVKKMLEKNMFLFGAVEINEGSIAERVNQLMELQNARVQVAYKK